MIISIREDSSPINLIYFGNYSEDKTDSVARLSCGGVIIFDDGDTGVRVTRNNIPYLIKSLEKHLELLDKGE